PMRGVRIDYLVINTDALHLGTMAVSRRLSIGDHLTRGRGAGGDPDVGRSAAEESREAIAAELQGADLVFIAAGMGGGTGTGGAPIIAQIAKEAGALTIAVVTTPFTFEGIRRARVAQRGLVELARHVDTMIVMPNDRVLSLTEEGASTAEAFRLADDVLRLGVQSVAELVAVPGDIILDFEELRAFMANAGTARMGTGMATGAHRALAAARAALSSPMLGDGIAGAASVLCNVTASADAGMPEVREALDAVRAGAGPSCEVLLGMVTDPAAMDQVRVTLIASGMADCEVSGAQGPSHRQLQELSVVLDEIDGLFSALCDHHVYDARRTLADTLEDISGAGRRLPLTNKMLVDSHKLRTAVQRLYEPVDTAASTEQAQMERIAVLLDQLRRTLSGASAQSGQDVEAEVTAS
ncbi:MAG: cell division protein FtsZ, partial [Dehalococcoidia bacterium]